MNGRMAIVTLATATIMAVGCETPHRRPPPPPPRIQYPSQPLSLADVKMLAKAGMSDEVIISQIRNSHTVYRLSAADILDLKDAGLSERVIDFMINTPALYHSSRPPAPPPSY